MSYIRDYYIDAVDVIARVMAVIHAFARKVASIANVATFALPISVRLVARWVPQTHKSGALRAPFSAHIVRLIVTPECQEGES